MAHMDSLDTETVLQLNFKWNFFLQEYQSQYM